MASPSRSFSALLNSSTASGLSSDYPGQVEGWVLKCTKKAYGFVVPRTLLCYIPVRDTCILRGGHIYCPMF